MNNPGSGVSPQRAVFAFVLGMLFFGYAFVQRVAPSVMTDELMRDFSVGAASLGILSGAYFYTYALLQLPVGLLTDRYGPRKLMSFALFVCAVASVGFAYSESLLTASIFRALIGAAVAFGFVGTLSIISQFFSPLKFAMMAGMVQSVGMLGAMLGQAPLRLMVDAQGWQPTFWAMAVFALVLGGLLFFGIPRRVAVAGGDAQSSLLSSLRSVARNPQSWVCAVIGFGLTAPMLSFAGLWAIPWLEATRSYEKTAAAGLVSLLFAGWAVGSPIAGWLSDKVRRRKPVVIGGSVVSLIGFTLLVYGSANNSYVLAGLFFLTGIGASVMVVTFGSVRELNNPAYDAAAMGLVNMCVVGSGAIMQPFIGFVLDRLWDGQTRNEVPFYSAGDYQMAFSALTVTLLIALVAALLLRETSGENQWAKNSSSQKS